MQTPTTLLVFVSMFAPEHDGGIRAFHLDTATGRLAPASVTRGVPHPFFLAGELVPPQRGRRLGRSSASGCAARACDHSRARRRRLRWPTCGHPVRLLRRSRHRSDPLPPARRGHGHALGEQSDLHEIGPRHVAFDPAGRRLYAMNELSNSVIRFQATLPSAIRIPQA